MYSPPTLKYREPQPPPLVISHPLQSPPHEGDRHLAQKAWETLSATGAEEKLSSGYTGTGFEGGRHLVTAPPLPDPA